PTTTTVPPTTTTVPPTTTTTTTRPPSTTSTTAPASHVCQVLQRQLAAAHNAFVRAHLQVLLLQHNCHPTSVSTTMVPPATSTSAPPTATTIGRPANDQVCQALDRQEVGAGSLMEAAIDALLAGLGCPD